MRSTKRENLSSALGMRFFCFLLILPIVGCGAQAKRTAIRETNLITAPVHVMPVEQEPQRPLALPLNVAVYLAASGEQRWEWTTYDKGVMSRWGSRLRQEGIVDQLFLMSTLVASGSSSEEVRQAAARQGADVVFIVDLRGNEDSGLNPFALFYLTLIGYYLAPGTSAEALVLIDALALEVRSGRQLFTVEAEGKYSIITPGGWLDEDALADKARSRARHALGEEFLKGMRELGKELREQVQRPAVPTLEVPKIHQYQLPRVEQKAPLKKKPKAPIIYRRGNSGDEL